jgi:hypothetical protein
MGVRAILPIILGIRESCDSGRKVRKGIDRTAAPKSSFGTGCVNRKNWVHADPVIKAVRRNRRLRAGWRLLLEVI